MIKVYISFTYQDLVKHRESATRTLRQMNKLVVAMEDYTASDERPLDRCLADVGRCDLYVGIFAWRYGFIPPHTDRGKSITELEYEHAEKLKKPRLIFLVADGAAWPPPDLDQVTGEGDRGKKVHALREHLKKQNMCKFFTAPDDLALQVSTAVSNWLEKEQRGSSDQVEIANTLLPRDISKDICLIHTDLDTDYATEVAQHLSAQGLRVVVDRAAIFADGPEDFQRVEGTLRTCHGTMILISDSSARQMREQRRLGTLVELAAARAGPVMALCRSKDAVATATQQNLDVTVDVEAWQPRQSATPFALAGDRLAQLWPGLGSAARWVGLPVVVAAMTLDEARDLHAHARQIEDKLSKSALEQLKALKASMPTDAAMMQRYGPRRDHWRPFGAEQTGIRTLLRTMVDRLNTAPPSQLRSRMIKLQYYALDELMRDKDQLRPVFNEMAGNGCVLIIDEYSLFHPVSAGGSRIVETADQRPRFACHRVADKPLFGLAVRPDRE